MLILSNYNNNIINIEPMLTRTLYQILTVYQGKYWLLISCGLHLRPYNLDNECSIALIHYLDSQDVDFQLLPSNIFTVTISIL